MFSKLTSLFKSKAAAKGSPEILEKPNHVTKSIEDGIPKNPITTSTIKTYVSGIKLEDRHDKLKKLIAELKKEKFFKELYQGLSNKDILDEEHGNFFEEDPVYELSGAKLPHVRLDVSDSSEVISVYVGKDKDHEFLLGVLPEDGTKRVLKRLESADLHAIEARLSGGKYKYLDDDDKVKTGEKNYNLQLKLKFIKNNPPLPSLVAK